MTLGLLGVALVCAVSSVGAGTRSQPHYASINQVDQRGVYYDQFDSSLIYNITNQTYNFDSYFGLDDDQLVNYVVEDYPYSFDVHSQEWDELSLYRAFMFCDSYNPTNAPTFNNTTHRYDFPANCSFIYGLYDYDNVDGIVNGIYIFAGAYSDNGWLDNAGVYGGRYYTLAMTVDVCWNNFSNGHHGTVRLQGHASNVSPNYYTLLDRTNDFVRYYAYVPMPQLTEIAYGGASMMINITPANFVTHGEDFHDGYSYGHEVGVEDGYDAGYQAGYNEGVLHDVTFVDLMGSIADTPIIMLRSLFDFELFGINMLTVVMSLMTGLIIFGLIRKFVL